jgi:3',5'-cyclic AMP phosphodiesterase CpdA
MEYKALVESLGANRVIDYLAEDFTKDKDVYDFFLTRLDTKVDHIIVFNTLAGRSMGSIQMATNVRSTGETFYLCRLFQ